MPDLIPHSHGFLDRLRAGLQCCGPAQRLVVAVSGGADSVALLSGLATLRQELNLQLVAAHLNHQIRGSAADDDAEFVRNISLELKVPIEIRSRNIPAEADQSGESLEEAARRCRYEMLRSIAQEKGYDNVATAHSADDQVETILHHVLRGTSINGLRGMPRVRALADDVRLIRPLLDVRRPEIEAWLRVAGLTWKVDHTNLDTSLTRNRIRHVLLPEIRREFNPQIDRALLTLASQAGEIADWMSENAEQIADRCCLQADAGQIRIDAAELERERRAVVRAVLVAVWKRNDWPRKAMGFPEWDRLVDVLTNGGATTLPGGIDARRRGKLLVLTRSETGTHAT